MMRTLWIGLAGMLAGAFFAWILLGTPDTRVSGMSEVSPEESATVHSAVVAHEEFERLRAELEIEREMRSRLAEQIEILRQARLGPGASNAQDRGEGSSAEAVPDSKPASAPTPQPEPAWFRADELRAAGLDEREIERVREVWDRYEMERIELRHRIAREEASGQQKKQHAYERIGIAMRARDELGDAGYDALLYASGQQNRVILSEILDSSPAAAAGLKDRDVLIRYDGERVFQPRELLYLVATGERGEWVEVVVARQGEIVRHHVPRGPLGVRFNRDRQMPRPD